jgi:hypothetical protein
MIQIEIVADQKLIDYANRMGVAKEKLPIAMARAMNRAGTTGKKLLRRALAAQTGMKQGSIEATMKVDPAHPGNLTWTLNQRGKEVNISQFGARKGKRGVTARPWAQSRMFRGTFFVGGKVYARTSAARGPLKQIWGPNLAREIVIKESKAAFEEFAPVMLKRVMHEIEFLGMK